MVPNASADNAAAPGSIKALHVYCKAAVKVDLVQQSRGIAGGA